MLSICHELPGPRWLCAGPPKLLISFGGATHHPGQKPGQHPYLSSPRRSPPLNCYKTPLAPTSIPISDPGCKGKNLSNVRVPSPATTLRWRTRGKMVMADLGDLGAG